MIYFEYDPDFGAPQHIEAEVCELPKHYITPDELMEFVYDKFDKEIEYEDAETLFRNNIVFPDQFCTLQIIGR